MFAIIRFIVALGGVYAFFSGYFISGLMLLFFAVFVLGYIEWKAEADKHKKDKLK